jgi:hypothetical protein
MGIMSWDLEAGFSSTEPVRNPRLTVRCEYPDSDMPPTEVTFRLSPSYGLLTAREAHEWFIDMLRDHLVEIKALYFGSSGPTNRPATGGEEGTARASDCGTTDLTLGFPHN